MTGAAPPSGIAWIARPLVRSAMSRRPRRRLLVVALLLVAGCSGEGDSARVPTEPVTGGPLFTRYVALGQSNTAGYMSDGINLETQRAAYPVLLAERAGVTFHVPELALPGCPPPLAAPPTSTQRVGGGSAAGCALRVAPPPPYVSNLAVPSARLLDMVDNQAPDSRSNQLTTLILGGRTQLEAMVATRPTFVSVWPEGNDALGALITGRTSDVTPHGAFVAALDRVVAGIRQVEAQALLIGVVDVTLSPAVQPGAFFHALELTGQSPKRVLADCAYGTPGGSNLVGVAALLDPHATVISCQEGAFGVLSVAEVEQLRSVIAGYNEAIRLRAQSNGWAYLDPNVAFRTAAQNPSRVRRCQGLAQAGLSPLGFLQAVEASCPGPQAPDFWGSLLSYDPIHLGPDGHRFFYNAMAGAINQHYSTSLSSLPLGPGGS